MIESAVILMRCSQELDDLSKSLLTTEKELAQLEVDLTGHVEDFQVSLWEDHMDGEKLPPAEIRLALAHKAFDRDRLNRLRSLKAGRNRAKARLSDLREVVAAHRSIVSAEKTEVEASSGPQPQWSGA